MKESNIKNKILEGDSLTVLKTLPSESIDCIITSPPYWALRDYKTEGIVWDGKENCEHDWNPIEARLMHQNRNNSRGPNSEVFANPKRANSDDKLGFTSICQKCNAWKGQLGQEPAIDLYISHLIQIFNECKRILKKEGTCWVVLGDTYHGNGTNHNGGGKSGLTSAGRGKDIGIIEQKMIRESQKGILDKSLCLIPERFALKMIENKWILRNKIIWYKPNCMPSSAKDRFTVDYENIYFFTKSQKYYFKTQCEPVSQAFIERSKYHYGGNQKNVAVTNSCKAIGSSASRTYFPEKKMIMPNLEGRIKRCVWKISPKPFPEAHFAVFPPELVKQCLDAGCPSEICKKCKKAKIIDYIRPTERPNWERKINEGRAFNRLNGGVEDNWRKANPLIANVISCNCNTGFDSGIVLDPFMGSGTTALVALKNAMNFVGIELNPDYIEMAMKRIEPYLKQGKLAQYISD